MEPQVPQLRRPRPRLEILNLPAREDIRHGAYPLVDEALRRIAARAGYRPVAGASFFLAYEGDGTLY